MRLSSGLLYAASLFVVSALAGACMQQGEGDVCDPRAGNGGSADCQDGYVCTQPNVLAPGTVGYRCCPGDLALGTGVCALGQSMISSNPSAGPSDAADASDAQPTDDADAANTDATLVDAADAANADATPVDAADAAPNDASSADAPPGDAGASDGAATQ
jgi:hypothetical protein